MDLTRMESLRELQLAAINAIDDDIIRSILRKCTNLRQLNISHNAVSSAAFSELWLCVPTLRSLDVQYCANISAEDVLAVQLMCPHLRIVS